MISKFLMGNDFTKPLLLIVCIVFSLFYAGLAKSEVVGDIESGKNKISMCVGCHGIPNYKTAFPKTYRVPKIAGQRTAYIVSALKAYRSETRSHPSMKAVAGSMSDQDIADVAIFYSSIQQ